ncbi:hypothetical protein TKK_0004694 [Trichogramma kaykai]
MTSTGATLLSNSGANLNIVKQLGGWKSSSVAEGYIENSTLSKQKIFLGITNENNEPIAHCSKNNPYTLSTANEKQKARNKHNEDESSKTKKMNSHHKQPLTYSKNKNSNSVKIDSKAISNPNSAKSMPIETDSTPKSATSNANLVISTPIPATSIPNPSAAKDSASSTKRKLNLSDDDDFAYLACAFSPYFLSTNLTEVRTEVSENILVFSSETRTTIQETDEELNKDNQKSFEQ